MLSARKQKTKKKRSLKSDVKSDLKNMDVMTGTNPRNDYESRPVEQEIELDSESDEQLHGNVNPIGENIRSCVERT